MEQLRLPRLPRLDCRDYAELSATSQHAEQTSSLIAEHETVVESLHAVAAERSQSLHSLREDHDSVVVAMQWQHTLDIAQHEASRSDLDAEWERKLTAQAARHDAEVALMKDANAARIGQSQAALNALTLAAEERTTAFDTQCEEHGRALAALAEGSHKGSYQGGPGREDRDQGGRGSYREDR